MTTDKLAAVTRRGYVRVRRVLRHTGGGAFVLILLGAPCAFASALGVFDKHGLRTTVPAGWWATDQRMSSGVEPLFRLTVSDRRLVRTRRDSGPCYGGIGRQIQPGGVVAILREVVGSDYRPARFKQRPRRFRLPARQPGQDNSCLGDHATEIIFKDAGRGFYLWIAAGRAAPRHEVATLLALLNRLTIR
jgi:hypothetical protein